MKKTLLLVLLAAVAGSSNLVAGQIIVNNKTDEAIAGNVEFMGLPSTAESFSIPKGQEKEVYSGIACLNKYQIWAKSDKKGTIKPKEVYRGYACEKQKIVVKKDANGKLVIERNGETDPAKYVQ